VSATGAPGYRGVVAGNASGADAGTRSHGLFHPTAAVRSAQARGETLDQLLDRNLAELLQELRVAITGVQVLFAFLLGLAFTPRFDGLDAFALTVYTVTLLAAALATVVLIAPVSFHRLVFRRRQKAVLIAVADRMLVVGLALLVLAISSGVLLVLDVVLGRGPGLVGGGAVLLVATGLWYGLPVWARRTGAGILPEGAPESDRPAG
jgi:O-antigen/teichoic acid export membrane protein